MEGYERDMGSSRVQPAGKSSVLPCTMVIYDYLGLLRIPYVTTDNYQFLHMNNQAKSLNLAGALRDHQIYNRRCQRMTTSETAKTQRDFRASLAIWSNRVFN